MAVTARRPKSVSASMRLVSRFRSSHHCAAHSFANFGIKGTLAIYDSSAIFGFEVSTQTRGYNDRNFKSTALRGHWLAPKPMTEHHGCERSCKLGNDEGRHSGGCYPRKGVGKRPGNGDCRVGEGR